MRLTVLPFALAVMVSGPAWAREQPVDVAGGRVEDVALALARQTGSSIVVADRDIAGMVIGPIRGHFSAKEASEALARASGAQLVRAGPNAWRLTRAPQRPRLAKASPRIVQAPLAPPPPAAPEPEIIVVGSKRDLSLRDYAGQVNQIDGADLAFGGVGGTEKIAARVASVSTTHLGSGRNKLFIRGIADSSFTGPTQSTVGQYLGDLRLSYNAPDPDLRLSDLAAVEVLEGPQGTLYGAGSLGGIVRLVPNAPDLDASRAGAMLGSSITLHGKPGLDGSAMFNLPIAPGRAALRLSADGEIQGGYIDKPLIGRRDVNRGLVGSARATMRFDLGGGWLVDVTGVIQHNKGDDSQYADRAGPPLERSSAITEGYLADYRQGQFVLSGQIGTVRLRSTTGYTWQDLSERYDATLPRTPARLFVQSNRTRMVANETRAWVPLGERIGWVLGSSYTHNRTRLRRELGELNALVTSTGVANSVEEFTLYGEGSARLAEGLTVTAGGRMTWAAISGEGEDVLPDIAFEKAGITADRTERLFLPSAALTAQPLPDTTLYLRYQEGFRPGGLAIDSDFVRRFRNDHISAIEFGFRLGRARHSPFDLSASVSHTKWSDIQADYIDANGLPTTANVGDGRIWTVSVSGGANPAPGLRIDAGLIYNHSRISQPNLYLALLDYASAPITEVPNVAKFAARLGFDYRRNLGDRLDLKVAGWARYVGKSRLGVGPELGDLQGNYLESGLTMRVGRDGLGGTLGITNLTDTLGNRFSLGTPFAVGREQVTPLRPLTVRLGFDATF